MKVLLMCFLNLKIFGKFNVNSNILIQSPLVAIFQRPRKSKFSVSICFVHHSHPARMYVCISVKLLEISCEDENSDDFFCDST